MIRVSNQESALNLDNLKFSDDILNLTESNIYQKA